MPKAVKIEKIVRDPLTQCRVALNQDAIDSIKETLEDGGVVPPIALFTNDNKTYFIGDGFHRLAAHVDAGLLTIEAEVAAGGQEEAFIHNCRYNVGPRGVPMTRADKRKACSMALDRWGSTKSDNQIAELIGVSHTTVSDERAKRGEKSNSKYSPAKNGGCKIATSKGKKPVSAPETQVDDDEKLEIPDAKYDDFSQALESDGDVEVSIMVEPEVKSVANPITLANIGLNEFAEAVRQCRAIARKVFQIEGQSVKAPYLNRFSYTLVAETFNAILRDIEDYRPVGGTPEKPVVVRDQKALESMKGGGK